MQSRGHTGSAMGVTDGLEMSRPSECGGILAAWQPVKRLLGFYSLRISDVERAMAPDLTIRTGRSCLGRAAQKPIPSVSRANRN